MRFDKEIESVKEANNDMQSFFFGGGSPLNKLYNVDCMEAMRQIPDKYFQLAITDPPYGIGMDGQN